MFSMGCKKLTYHETLSPLKVVCSDLNISEISCVGSYRYGFNGMEKDDEVKGEGNSYTTEFRQYDPRVGRWLSLDPELSRYPYESPYVAFHNNPIIYTDPFGDSPPEGDPKTASAAKRIASVDSRTYEQFRGEGWTTDDYVDCSEFVYEVFLEAHGISVGTYTESILTHFKDNEKFKTDLSKANVGDVVFWVDPAKTDRNVTHVGIISEITNGVATVQHASYSQSKLTDLPLNINGKGALGKLEFVGLGSKIIDYIEDDFKTSISYHKDMISKINNLTTNYNDDQNPFIEILELHNNALKEAEEGLSNYLENGIELETDN